MTARPEKLVTMEPPQPQETVESLEVELLLEAIQRRYGCDFRDYALASLTRRIRNIMHSEKVATVSGLQERVLHEPAAMERFLAGLSVNVTSMFRDPTFFSALRTDVFPLLAAYPFVRIWHVGCSSGEEVYSTAILLHEAGLYERCRIYATDMNEVVLKRAAAGIFPLKEMVAWHVPYVKAGGKAALSDHYVADSTNAIIRHGLKKNVLFSHHNLVTDGSFNEFHLILCRNVMIYFNRKLQVRVHQLFYESLRRFGVLALGRRETLAFTPVENSYEILNPEERLYKRSA